jgi:hypothetical protein
MPPALVSYPHENVVPGYYPTGDDRTSRWSRTLGQINGTSMMFAHCAFPTTMHHLFNGTANPT